MHRYRYINQQSAFTLLELMIVITIAGILGAVALPSYQTMVKNNCLTTTTNNLVTHLQLARSEAVKRQQNITITQKTGGWDNGWTITDTTANILRDMSPTSCSNTTVTGSATSFTYRASGFISSSGTFSVCDDRTGETGRQININPVGRPHTDSDFSGCT